MVVDDGDLIAMTLQPGVVLVDLGPLVPIDDLGTPVAEGPGPVGVPW